MKCLHQYSYLRRQSSLISHYSHHYPLIQKSFCSGNRESRLKDAFLSKYQRKIQQSTTSEAWDRYQTDEKAMRPEELHQKGFATPEFDTPKEHAYNPHIVFGLPRATFRGLVIGISCLIGATLFVLLKPAPISEDKERENMHYFARLNADPSVHVTYSGLMYKIIEQKHLENESGNGNEDTDINLLTNPNPDIHCVNIDYEGRFVDGTVFDTSFGEEGMQSGGEYIGVAEGCVFPAKSLIAGIHQGLTNMTRDSVFEFYLPPHLGYGERGSEFIPPHQVLVFKVKLNDFWKDQHLDRPQRFKLQN